MYRIAASLILLCLSTFSYAQVDQYVVDVNTDKVYLYDEEGEEIAIIKSKAFKKAFTDHPTTGKPITGIKVLEIDEGEGLAAVILPDYSEPVWIETMAVELWPGNQLDCAEMNLAESQAQVAQSGMTIGFGDHCK